MPPHRTPGFLVKRGVIIIQSLQEHFIHACFILGDNLYNALVVGTYIRSQVEPMYQLSYLMIFSRCLFFDQKRMHYESREQNFRISVLIIMHPGTGKTVFIMILPISKLKKEKVNMKYILLMYSLYLATCKYKLFIDEYRECIF